LDLEQHAELAGDYYTLRGEDAEEVLLLNTVDDYLRSLALTENLYRGGAAAAERRVAAANAQIGVARAAYFPVFSLAAATGFNSTQTSTLLNAPSRLWSAGPSGLLTVFDAGRHRAQSAQAHAQ
jgi:outer membrane protein TolC